MKNLRNILLFLSTFTFFACGDNVTQDYELPNTNLPNVPSVVVDVPVDYPDAGSECKVCQVCDYPENPDDGSKWEAVCHVTPSGVQRTLLVGASAVQAHVDEHGDELGPCGQLN